MTGKKGMNVPQASLENLKKGTPFSADNPEFARKCNLKSQEARRLNREKEAEIENTAKIISRLLMKKIKNNATGEEITQKEAMILTLLNNAIVEKNLKSIEMVLKLIGEFDETNSTNITINQPMQVDKQELKEVIQDIMDLADEG